MADQSLRDAIRESSAGNKDAFRAVFDRCFDTVFRYLAARLQSRDDALDLAQDTFVDVWQALPRFRYSTDRQFYGFIFTIAKRKLAKQYANAVQTMPLDETRIGDTTLDIEDYRNLTKAISQLRSNYQELLRLRYWGGLSFSEIAAALGITENAAKVWHHRAVRKLRQLTKQP